MVLNNLSESIMISDLVDTSAKTYKDRTAFIYENESYTFEEIHQMSFNMAKNLLSIGLKKGDVIAVQLPNSLEFVITHLAAARVGLIFNPLSPTYRKKELTYMLGHCDTKSFITIDSWKGFSHGDLAIDLKDDLENLEHVIITGDDNGSGISFSQMTANNQQVSSEELEQNKPTEDEPAIIMFTSGTDSNPKAVLHTYETFVPAHLLNGKEYQVNEKDTILSLTPLCHMFSLPMIIIGLTYGTRHHLVSEYKLENIMFILEKELVSFLIAAPAHLIDMIHHIRSENVSGLPLRLILTGGSKIPSEMVKDLRKLVGCSVGAQWGMTEICAGTFTRPDDDESLTWETVGKASPSGEVVVLDENHEFLPAGEIGEIGFKGVCLFKEYYKNALDTQESLTEGGFYLTGDRGWLDENGYLHFVGRTKDTINRGGLKFHASEIEEVLQMHPKIQQAALVSVPDPRLGERACAFVSPRDDHSIELEEIKEFLLKNGFAKYKLPEYMEIRGSLPTTPSGKIMKGPLREEVESLINQ
ncbi:class I adenylate-forming enzyme family protein [Thalassobacillus sp. CUG 92003]|uniref:class I adenylate-forming enzyme family protein n=1 Tax=Thalassobacillus sp. CUG 92003 TaxID=2736641 RepID=UPI0015E74100|nr:class I adenylate-forming enzyme family protein [Thalassobacillus sp. CUG 92003]